MYRAPDGRTVHYITHGQHHEIEHPATLPYELVGVLGHGGSAVVEKVRDIISGSVYARKTIRVGGALSKVKDVCQHEVDVIRRLASHHHMIRVFATYRTGRTFAIILDPVASEGDLGGFLERYRDLEKSKERTAMFQILKRAFGCLSSGLAFMHRKTIRHKDIKPQNILIHRGEFIFTDFGVARNYQNDRSTTEGHPGSHTKRYCAPEVADWGQRNSSSDVFSLGCVFLEILASRFRHFFAPQFLDGPFHTRIERILDKLKKVERFLEDQPCTMYSFLMAVVQNMLCKEAGLRNTALLVSKRLRRYKGDMFCLKCLHKYEINRTSCSAVIDSMTSCSYCSNELLGEIEYREHVRHKHFHFDFCYKCGTSKDWPSNISEPCQLDYQYNNQKQAYLHIVTHHLRIPINEVEAWGRKVDDLACGEPNAYYIYAFCITRGRVEQEEEFPSESEEESDDNLKS